MCPPRTSRCVHHLVGIWGETVQALQDTALVDGEVLKGSDGEYNRPNGWSHVHHVSLVCIHLCPACLVGDVKRSVADQVSVLGG